MSATKPPAPIVPDSAASAAMPTEAEVRAVDLEREDVVLLREVAPDTTRDSNAGDLREEMIRREAYATYERRGCVPGHEDEDWLEAERRVDSAKYIDETGE